MNVTEEIELLQLEIEHRLKRIEWLKSNQAKLEPLPRLMFMACEQVDFDNLSHPEVVKVIRTFGGKWKKEPASDNTIHYTTKLPDGMTVRCFKGQPPPSCKIIEVEEHVPAQVIPATVRKVRKLVCLPEVGAIIASAAERGVTEQ